MKQKFTAIVSLPWNKGQKKLGTEEGALWFAQYIENGLGKKANEFYVDEKLNICDNLKRMYDHIHQFEPPYIFCGGDHSEAISTVLAVVNHERYQGKKIGVIWVDAHADINTYQKSLTKNYHGMPLSFACGVDKTFPWVNQLKTLSLKNLIYYGIRDLDEYEKIFVKEENIRVVKVEDDYTEVFQWLKDGNFDVIHLSFDIDGIDPAYIISTGTTAPNGIPKDRACQFFRRLRETFEELKIEWNVELVEYNPRLGGEQGRKTTEDNLRQILDSIFK